MWNGIYCYLSCTYRFMVSYNICVPCIFVVELQTCNNMSFHDEMRKISETWADVLWYFQCLCFNVTSQYLYTTKYPSAIFVQIIWGIINSLNSYRTTTTNPHFVVSSEVFFLFGVFVDLLGVRGVNMGVVLGAILFFFCVATTLDGWVLSLVGILHAHMKKVMKKISNKYIINLLN